MNLIQRPRRKTKANECEGDEKDNDEKEEEMIKMRS